MNIENMTKLRDHLQWLVDNDKTYKFNMSNWLGYRIGDNCVEEDISIGGLIEGVKESEGIDITVSPYECGTVACLAGHAALIGGAKEGDSVREFAADWLGIDVDDRYSLFMGVWSGKQMNDITIEDAINHLNTLIKENS